MGSSADITSCSMEKMAVLGNDEGSLIDCSSIITDTID